MADVFQPRFVDMVRNTTTSVGTVNFQLGPAVMGYTGFTVACAIGDSFYYSAIGIDRPNEVEVGRGTLLGNGTISRDPISGTKTNFSTGTKTIALIAAAEWYQQAQALLGASANAAVAASDRATLAALSGASLANLGEPGREGLFRWDGTNRSTLVAADNRQGLSVAPASDPSGASGAWLRTYSGAVNVRWFGAAGDGVADDSAAFVAAVAALKAIAVNNDGNLYKGSPRLFVPTGLYNLGTTTLDITHTVIVEGESSINGYASRLKWSGDCDGIRVQAYNSSGAATVDGPHFSGSYTIIRNLGLAGPHANVTDFTGRSEGEFHGINARSPRRPPPTISRGPRRAR